MQTRLPEPASVEAMGSGIGIKIAHASYGLVKVEKNQAQRGGAEDYRFYLVSL